MAEKDDMTAIRDELAVIRNAVFEGSMNNAHDVWLLMEYDADKKSFGVAYLLWMLVGWVGGHRFYLRKYITAVFILCLSAVPVSFVLGLFGTDYGVWGFIETEVGFNFEDVKAVATIVVVVLVYDLFRVAGLVSEENRLVFLRIQARHFALMKEVRAKRVMLEQGEAEDNGQLAE